MLQRVCDKCGKATSLKSEMDISAVRLAVESNGYNMAPRVVVEADLCQKCLRDVVGIITESIIKEGSEIFIEEEFAGAGHGN